MSVRKKKDELLRLRRAFEAEAAEFPDLSLSVLYVTQDKPVSNRPLRHPHHFIVLWQYYGTLETSERIDQLMENIRTSNVQLAGVRGSEFSCFALIEGPKVEHFLRMAKRAGSIFSFKEALRIKTNTQKDFESNVRGATPLFISNANPVATWLNYVLHHLGKTHPFYLSDVTIHLDPFAASLSAIDQLVNAGSVSSTKKPPSRIDSMRFRVALSFPGEHRAYVEEVALLLREKIGTDGVFYDNFYQPHLARPNLDTLLQRIYHDNSDLVVIFLCADYERKQWCGLEWRAIRDLIKQTEDDKLMFLRFDDASISGLFGIDGYIDVSKLQPIETVKAILDRIGRNEP